MARHHYVPQFYLRNFAVDLRARRIALFILPRSQFVSATSIRDQAQQDRLYGDESVERAFSEMETRAADVIRAALERRVLPARLSAEHGTLLRHVVFQSLRTLAAGDEVEQSYRGTFEVMVENHPLLAPFKDHIQMHVRQPLADALRIASASLPLTVDLCYKLLVNESKCPLITSDHPAVLYNQFVAETNSPWSGVGLASRGLQVFLPLSEKVCLVLFDSNVYKVGGRRLCSVTAAINSADVDSLNLLQVATARSHVYCGATCGESYVRLLVARVGANRMETRSRVEELSARGQGSKNGKLLIHSKEMPNTKLVVSCINRLRTAGNRKIHSMADTVRDPVLCQLHDEFCRLCDAGRYREDEFQKFIDAKLGGAVARIATRAGR